MVEKKMCEYCGENITENQKHVLLATIISKKDRQDSYFHFDCFVKNHDEKVNKKARNIIGNMQSQAQSLFQNLQGMAGNVQGLGQIGSMLGINLEESKFTIGENPLDQDLTKFNDHKNDKKTKGKSKK